MKVLVTGANSMLGSNIVEVLHENGFAVCAIVRNSNDIVDRYCEVFSGNVADVDQLKNAAKGCDAIVHVAAITNQSLLKLDDYKFNWNVVENVAIVAKELSIEKIVVISSANSIGNGTAEIPANEYTPLEKPYINSLYGRSKVMAEDKLFKISPNAVVLNPTFMIGKYDSKPSSGYLIKMGYKKRFVFVPSGGKDFVPTIDVAKAVVQALKNDVCGKFIVGGVSMSFKQFMLKLSVLDGYKTVVIIWPKWTLKVVGWIGDSLRFLGIKVPISSPNMEILNSSEFYSSNNAKKQLGYINSDLDKAIIESADWMKNNGVIKRRP